jgi:signal transduction histidine kinase
MIGRVVLSGDFGPRRVDDLCAALSPLSDVGRPEGAELDFSGLRSISASCMALLVSSLRTVRSRGVCDPLKQLTGPEEPYLQDLLGAVGLGGLLGHPADGRPIPGDPCGCEPFSNVQGAMRAQVRLLSFIVQRTPLRTAAEEALSVLIWDLAQNVLRHALADGGVAAVSVDLEAATLELAVADCGIGVRASLVRNSQFEDLIDDAIAIREALAPGVTSAPGSGKGMGLYLAKLVLAANEGTLTIRSGDARISVPGETGAEESLPGLRGTLVSAVARLDHALDRQVVDRALADPHGVAS